MAAMSPEAQALSVLQREMAETRAHVTTLTSFYEALKGAHDALNLAAQQALADKDQKIYESETRLKNMLFKQQFDLLLERAQARRLSRLCDRDLQALGK